MRFAVVWKPGAEAELARLWTEADDRAAVASAADEIDRLLSCSPNEQGESRAGSTRVILMPPLAVFFEIVEADQMVCVLHVRRSARH